ncbi:MAG: hypothetical protein ABGY71_13580 [bacterium]|jgi:hypothetical protein
MSPQPSPSTLPVTPAGVRQAAAERLAGRLVELTRDRASTARAVACECAAEIRDWARAESAQWNRETMLRDLEEGWGEWCESHTWRGPCALFVDDLRGALAGSGDLRTALDLETSLWTREGGRGRLADTAQVAAQARALLHPGDWVLVHGYSEPCIAALVLAQEAGLAPLVLLSEGAADTSGKRMARELLSHGVRVRLGRDLATLAAIDEVDWVWLGSEALGAGCFVAPLGSGLLLQQARTAEVPTRVLATSSDLLPGGDVRLPAWGEKETEGLWSRAPEGVELCAQPFEFVATNSADGWITEQGHEGFHELSLRALRCTPHGDLRA